MSIPVLKQAANGFWYARWSDGRRSKRESMGTKEGAEASRRFAHWTLARDQIARTDSVDYDVGRLWAVYAEKHIDVNVAAPATLRYVWKNLEPHFGLLPLSAIDQNCVEDYEKKRRLGRIGKIAGGPTVRRELGALRACLNWCAEPKRRIISPAQVPPFDLPAEGEPRDRWLRREEIDRLLDAAAFVPDEIAVKLKGGKWQDRTSRGERFLRLALETAGRKTALLELTWDRVDFETGVIHLNVPGRKQTKKRRADVPISASLRPHLERWHRERVNDYVLDHKGDVWAAVQIIAERAGFGDPNRPTRSNGAKPKRTGISPHVLRHTAATHMARRGVPLYDIAGVLGNTLAMVEKVYAHHCPERLREAVNMISGDTK